MLWLYHSTAAAKMYVEFSTKIYFIRILEVSPDFSGDKHRQILYNVINTKKQGAFDYGTAANDPQNEKSARVYHC